MGLFGFFKKEQKPLRTWAVIDVTDADFKQQVIQRSHKTPVLVDFWAAWCGPCRVLGPVLEDLAAKPDSEFLLAKLDTENNRRTAQSYQIQSIPAVKMFRNGHVVDEFSGARPAALVKRFISKSLSHEPPTSKISGSADPAQRLAQARRLLKQGRGFEAYVLLSDFPPGLEEETAAQLLPLAQFLFDSDLGDTISGDAERDETYETLWRLLRRRKYDAAEKQLEKIAALGDVQTVSTEALEKAIMALRNGR